MNTGSPDRPGRRSRASRLSRAARHGRARMRLGFPREPFYTGTVKKTDGPDSRLIKYFQMEYWR
jgi:hypothetical protein